MSLLCRAPQTVLAHPEEDFTDDDGNPAKRPAVTAVAVRAFVQPVSAVESAALGQQATTIYRVIATDWPTGAFGSVEWDGRTWDVLGEPQRRTDSAGTRHASLLIRSRG